MSRMRYVFLGLGVAALAFTTNPARAAELSAEQIAKQAYERHANAYANLKAAIKMTLTSAKGEQKIRDVEMMGMRTAEGLLRTLTRFQGPADIAGTALLVLEQANAPPEQYLYLSSFNKVRRIPGTDSTVSFMGSDFTFLDLNPALVTSIKDVVYERLDDATFGDIPVYVIALKPQVKGVPYSRLIVSVHKELLIPMKVEFFDETGAPLKVMSVRKLQQFKVGNIMKTIPLVSEMKNLQRGSSTILSIEKVDVDVPLDPQAFTPASLLGR